MDLYLNLRPLQASLYRIQTATALIRRPGLITQTSNPHFLIQNRQYAYNYGSSVHNVHIMEDSLEVLNPKPIVPLKRSGITKIWSLNA
jgi:hypothetical protein